MSAQIDTLARYFNLIEAFAADPAAFDTVYHPDFVQTEFPNAMSPEVRERNRALCLQGAQLGKQLLAKQSLQVERTVESGNQVVVEAVWTGTVAQAMGPLYAGQKLKAFICMIFEFKDGRIYRQRNYDCYDPSTLKA